MPELPEVELASKFLSRLVEGRRITTAELLRQRLAPSVPADRFSALLENSTIKTVSRRGKFILMSLDSGRTLLTHLRMSGRFMLLPTERADPKFAHAVLNFDDGYRLVFQDQRHFGYMAIAETNAIQALPEIAKLAPEPLSDDFSAAYLQKVFASTGRPVKEVLLDQTKVCGLGNIYAAEALFRSKIHPAARSNRVSRKRVSGLADHIREVLRDAIAAGSTLNVDPEYIDGSYSGGEFESRWAVYDREGLPCPQCSSVVVRLKQAGRSSYFCPKCQKR